MQILHYCPAKLATGGTEGIHNLVHYLNKAGADAKILYEGADLQDPQPTEYAKYECEYVTEYPNDFSGLVIFPEVWGNRVAESKYQHCMTAINWQGVDVYNWHTPINKRGWFMYNKSTIHIAASEYAMDYLEKLGLRPIKISDCLNDTYFQEFTEEYKRDNTVLYNPTSVKLTNFQVAVMEKCEQRGVKFQPLKGYTQSELIDLFRHRKLYIDFGVFSGRERLPREAVMCGCTILTSNKGTAGYYKDNSILEKYKCDNEDYAVQMILYMLEHYEQCRHDFDEYRRLLRADKSAYPDEVKELYHEILNHNTGI